MKIPVRNMVFIAASVLLYLLWAGMAYAQVAEEIIVVGILPNGTTLDKRKIPFPVQSSTAEDLQRGNAQSIADFLERGFSSVSLNDAQNNPLQPDLQYRGFTASPLLGLAQGLSVYQNGARINEPIGDAVNWDLLPQSAIHSVTLSGGANPLYGLNSLGGALVMKMKDGFNFEGSKFEVATGSFGRTTSNIESGGNIARGDNSFAYYGNIEYFDEEGWRAESASDAINFFGSLGWKNDTTAANVSYQHGDSYLTGNGAAPAELLAIDRSAIFTGPDITDNELDMFTADFQHAFSSTLSFAANAYYRQNKTQSINGDGSEFGVCNFNSMPTLLEGLEEDDLEELGFDDDDVCDSQFNTVGELESFLNIAATAAAKELFDLNAFEAGELSGSGFLSDQAINNLSNRTQETNGLDLQWTWLGEIFGYKGQLIVGGSYFNGESVFNSVLELSEIDPLTRLTTGLGTGVFVGEEATSINTETETTSLFLTSTVDLRDDLALTISARGNRTDVVLQDLSGRRPELNGDHRFTRLNPSIGLTWQLTEDHNLYSSYSESSRAPTPIELACNEGVFDLAVKFAIERGEDPEDVNFECRLPNAFLADPPLDDVVAESFELGSRGFVGELEYSAGIYYTTNKDDILFQTTGRSTGLFANVDKTLRTGFESQLRGQWDQLSWMTTYSHVRATFESEFTALSPNHDFADEEGEISIENGDQIPGIPQHQFKLLTDYQLTPEFSVGLDLVANSEQYIRGDESNQLDTVPGYLVSTLRASYVLRDNLEAFLRVDNLFDNEFETFGLLGEEPGELEVPIIEDLTIPRFLGAAAPRSAFIGFRYKF
jgi:outer membrane receptor protein involved in Fe transport